MSFGATRALDDAGISVRRGEIHALLGQNGSGKSTLVKVLAGYHVPGPGAELTVAGRRLKPPFRVGWLREIGVRFVHQDLGLIPSLSVVENLLLDDLPGRRVAARISWPKERARATEAFARYGVTIDPRSQVADLTPADQALLAIVRAVRDVPSLLVLDEPTALLPPTQREGLLTLLREIVAGGSSILLVSHELGEVVRFADRVTVLRDGRTVGTVDPSVAGSAGLVELVVGRALDPPAPRRDRPAEAGAPIAIGGLSGATLRDVSMAVGRGEVVGVTGAGGSGFEELPYLLFGARPALSGRVRLREEHDLPSMTPDRALRAGIGLLPGDRQRDGAASALSVAANVSLPVLDRYFRGLRLDRRRLLGDVARLLKRHGVSPSGPRLRFGALSGGNQQKALLAKWIHTESPLLLLDEPTVGVDVGARVEIAAAIRALASKGVGVVCASTDHEQLASLCDRVLVFSEGRIGTELSGEQVTKERIAEQCSLSA